MLHHIRSQLEGGHLKVRMRAFTRKPNWFPVSKTVRNKFLLFTVECIVFYYSGLSCLLEPSGFQSFNNWKKTWRGTTMLEHQTFSSEHQITLVNVVGSGHVLIIIGGQNCKYQKSSTPAQHGVEKWEGQGVGDRNLIVIHVRQFNTQENTRALPLLFSHQVMSILL